MGFLRMLFSFILSDDDNSYFDDDDDDYYLSEPSVDLTGDSLDGGDIYVEPDYIIND